MPNGKKKGRWQGQEARDFDDFKDAIREVLNQQAPGSTWVVEIEVKKVGNPLHDYRIVLSPPA
jgi:hypothetical protein